MEHTLNQARLGFVVVLISMIVAGIWLGLQWSPMGFTLAGRYGFTATMALSFVGGIVIPMILPQVRGMVLGALLGGLGTGMVLGIFTPGIIAIIPPDVLASLTSNFVFGEDWGLGPVVTIVLFLLLAGGAFFTGLALKGVTQKLWRWLHTNPSSLSLVDSGGN